SIKKGIMTSTLYPSIYLLFCSIPPNLITSVGIGHIHLLSPIGNVYFSPPIFLSNDFASSISDENLFRSYHLLPLYTNSFLLSFMTSKNNVDLLILESNGTYDSLRNLLALKRFRSSRAPFKSLSLTLHSALTNKVSEVDRKSTRLNSSHVKISYAVFC